MDEIERDILAWTESAHVFGKQPWLGALDGTALGREIHHELTEGTRPPFPLTPSTMPPAAPLPAPPAAARTSERDVRREARRAKRRRQRHVARLLAGASLRLPRVRRHLRTSGNAVLNLDPLAETLATVARRACVRWTPHSSGARACACAWP